MTSGGGDVANRRVAVGLGIERRLGADVAATTGLVFDHDGLAPLARQPVEDDARHEVGRPARRIRHDHLHGATGVILGLTRVGQERQQDKPGRNAAHPAAHPRHACHSQRHGWVAPHSRGVFNTRRSKARHTCVAVMSPRLAATMPPFPSPAVWGGEKDRGSVGAGPPQGPSFGCRSEQKVGDLRRSRAGGASAAAHTSTFSAAMKASWGMSTLPNWRMRFLPSFCLSRSLRLRVTSPP